MVLRIVPKLIFYCRSEYYVLRIEDTRMNPNPSSSNEPKIPRADAEAMIKLMEQELALQRAKLATNKATAGANVARWTALVFVLLFLLGVMIWGFARLQAVKLETPTRPPPPPTAPARR